MRFNGEGEPVGWRVEPLPSFLPNPFAKRSRRPR